MTNPQRDRLVQALLNYPKASQEFLDDMQEMVESDIRALEPLLDRMLLDAKFETLLELAAEAQKNEVCKNCGVRSIPLPF